MRNINDVIEMFCMRYMAFHYRLSMEQLRGTLIKYKSYARAQSVGHGCSSFYGIHAISGLLRQYLRQIGLDM